MGILFYAALTACSTALNPYADCNPPIKAGVEQRIEMELGPHGTDKALCEKYADTVRKTYTADKKLVAKTAAEKALVDYRQIKYQCFPLEQPIK